MPGAVAQLTAAEATGWARHAARPGYPVIVSAILNAHVVASAIADLPKPSIGREAASDEAGGSPWFVITFAPLELTPEELAALRFVVGETDEALATRST